MTKQHIKASYAKLDPAHAFDGLFVPTNGKNRGRLLVKMRRFGNLEIGFQGFEQLGPYDQSVLLAITAQLGIDGLVIEDDSGDISKQLLQDLKISDGHKAPIASKKTSYRSLLLDTGQHPKKGTNDIKASLNRLRNAQIREVDKATRWDRVSNLISCSFNVETGDVYVAANPRLTQAVFAGQHIRVSLFERNALKSDVAKLLHCWLCSNVRLGATLGNGRGVTIETLAKHVWGIDAWESFAAPDKSKKRTQVRNALDEIRENTKQLQPGQTCGWSIHIRDDDLAIISRPKDLPVIESILGRLPSEIHNMLNPDPSDDDDDDSER